jgi:AcrR family transcriptional regulator
MTAVGERDDVRARVLEAALELFAAKGFAATSTREIAKKLGFTKATLYYYFETKEALLLAMLGPVEEALNDLIGGLSPPLNSAERRRLLAGYVDFQAVHGRALRVLTQDPSTTTPSVVSVTRPLYEQLLALVTGEAHPSLPDLVRARVALGGISEAVRFRSFEPDLDKVKPSVLAAACGALGMPPKPSRGGTR